MVLYCNNTQSFHRRILFEPRLHIYVPARLMSFEEIFHAFAFIFGATRYNSRVWKRWTHSDMFLSLNRCEHNICRSTVHNITLWMIHSCSLCRNSYILTERFLWQETQENAAVGIYCLISNFADIFSYSKQIRHPTYLSTIWNKLFAFCGVIEFELKI